MTDIEVLQNTLERTQSLKYQDDHNLDDIIRKGKMVLQNLFPTKLYWIEIEQIHFRQHTGNVTEEVLMRYWIKAQQQLINLFHTALLDYTIQQQKMNQKKVTERVITVLDKEGVDAIRLELKNYKKKVRNWSLFALLLIISSLMIWIFFMYSDWDWYLSHPKKLGITLMVNLALLIIFLNVPLKSKWLIWISIIVPILIALFSIL